MKHLLIAFSVIMAPVVATAQWVPDYSSPQYQMQQQMLEQQRQQTAAQQQMLMEMQNQRLQQQQLYGGNCAPMVEPRRPLGSFIDGWNAGRCRR
jgi:hypothetical protein